MSDNSPKKKRIVCFHLFNDHSGSPKVLYQIVKELLQNGYQIDLITSKGGVLDAFEKCDSIRIHYYNYRFSSNRVVTGLRYGRIQLYTFLYALRYLFKQDVIFYINTILPFGPALAGKIMGKTIIYHYHENAYIKGLFYKSLSRIMQGIASKIVCVSAYQRSFLKRKKNIVIIPNALDSHFCMAFNEMKVRSLPEKKKVLMLSSLKYNKGIVEFIKLAQRLPQYTFCLVINEMHNKIEKFLSKHNFDKIQNLEIFDRQDDVIPFYQDASLVLNLSHKEQFVETFGLTALEAMTAAIPVIVPTVGGIAEMVDDGVNGYKIDVEDLDKIEEQIDKILSDNELYNHLSFHAKKYAGLYDIEEWKKKITALFE